MRIVDAYIILRIPAVWLWHFRLANLSTIIKLTLGKNTNLQPVIVYVILAAPCENVSSGVHVCGEWRPWSACADQGLHCPLIQSFDTIECINGAYIPKSDVAHAWDDSESVHFAHARRHIFAWRGPYMYFSIHYENTPIQIYWKFHHQKNENFQIKNPDIFHTSAQNIDCGYSLEPLKT